MTRRRITRRSFLAAAGATLFAPTFIRARNLASKMNIAMIACGGRGAANMNGVASENITVLCDVYAKAVEVAAHKYPDAKKFTDFRRVFDNPNLFEAVVVSTCEHTHAFATMLALKHGKHVYCEKPLTYNIAEARRIREEAAKVKVTTQMGIQNHANDNYRQVVEMVQSGMIGPVREVHVWVNRAWGLQSEEAFKRNEANAFKPESGRGLVYFKDRPTKVDPIPEGLDWDLWIGPAPARPFSIAYHPGPRWYRWWDFGNGTMSDLGSHSNDLAFWALKLKAPLTIEASGPPPHPEIAPATMSATYEYGARGDLPPVNFTWYQGEMKPKLWNDNKIPQWKDGTLFIGDKGMLLADYRKNLLLPEAEFAGFKRPEATLPRVANHYVEWIEACKNGKQALANFEYSGWLTEANHLGNVAYRVGKKLEWDPENLRAKNAPEAEKYIRREYRDGWVL